MSQILIHRCIDCNKEINPGKIGMKTLCDYCAYERKKKHARDYARKKMLLKVGRECLRCRGSIKKYKQRYCSDYCRWLNDLKNHNAVIRRQIEMVRNVD